MRKIGVFGMGAISPIGNSVPELWQSLLDGKSGIGPITHFDPADIVSFVEPSAQQPLIAEVTDAEGKKTYIDLAAKGPIRLVTRSGETYEPTTVRIPRSFSIETRESAEVRDFDAEAILASYIQRHPRFASLPPEEAASLARGSLRQFDPFSLFAIAATMEAVSGIPVIEDLFRVGDKRKADERNDRAGCYIGTGIGGAQTWERGYHEFLLRGPSRVGPRVIPGLMANRPVSDIATLFGLTGGGYAVVNACASGKSALMTAIEAIHAGTLDLAVVGGTEACDTAYTVSGFTNMQALAKSSRYASPEAASRPFDIDRSGFVIGEGAAMFVIADLDYGKSLGLKPIATILGYGMSNDAFHPTAPHPDALGMIVSMRNALGMADIRPSHVDYINSHGTSTELNDPLEAKAIEEVFGDWAETVRVTSTKANHGHLLGAAGALESAIAIQVLRHGIVPPQANLNAVDPACARLNIPTRAMEGDFRVTMSNSLAFGGGNATIIYARPDFQK
ncbi:MAG: beta-ketoacyl-[acyl-carrier-protein] synthase family protein [Nanoarchaeota archaeon]